MLRYGILLRARRLGRVRRADPRSGRFPIIGDGAGIWSFLHISDAAAATVCALEHGAPGVYNVVDDEPASVAEWLPFLARAIGAKAPYRVPRWIGRLAAGETGVSMMTQIRGSSNAKAKRELGWQPALAELAAGFPGRPRCRAAAASRRRR